MNDREIVKLYFARNEQALRETEKQYGKYCHYIANNILSDSFYADEVVNDTYLRLWNSIPPAEPDPLRPYVGTISRNLALDKLKHLNAEKRNEDGVPLILEELEECIPSGDGEEADETTLRELLDSFIASLSKRKRVVFMRRYWYAMTVGEIAEELSVTEGSVKTMLSRTRRKLREFLEKEGITI